MAPKKNKRRGRRSKTPGQTSASDPNPTATSPSASAATGDAATASPSAPPTTTKLIPSAPPRPTSILPSSPSHIATTSQPLPSAPPLPIQEIHEGRVSCTSDGANIADPSASTRTPRLLPITKDIMSLYAPAVAGSMAASLYGKEEEPEAVQEVVVGMLGWHLDEMETAIRTLLELAMKRMNDAEVKVALDAMANMPVLRSVVGLTEMLLAERKKRRNGSGGSCGGSEGKGGGPDGGSGEGDGEGGGVSV